jgi:hypothetical protein
MGLDMYWRKANAIHGWFVRECASGVDECQPIFVPRHKLRELRNDCVQALADKAKNLVPDEDETSGGTVIIPLSEDGTTTFSAIMDYIKTEQAQASHTLVETADPLAPVNGFFFGSDSKDEWYYRDIEETLSIIDQALGLSDEWEFIYQASW